MSFDFLYNIMVAYMPFLSWYVAPLVAGFVLLTALSIIHSLCDLKRL